MSTVDERPEEVWHRLQWRSRPSTHQIIWESYSCQSISPSQCLPQFKGKLFWCLRMVIRCFESSCPCRQNWTQLYLLGERERFTCPVWQVLSFALFGVFSNMCSFSFQFSEEIENLYSREDFVGSVAFQFLSPPRSPPKDKNIVSSPVSLEKRQALSRPKIRLRWLASYQNLGYILAAYLFLYMWFGLGIVGFAFFGLLFGLLYGVTRAVVNPRPKAKDSWKWDKRGKNRGRLVARQEW